MDTGEDDQIPKKMREGVQVKNSHFKNIKQTKDTAQANRKNYQMMREIMSEHNIVPSRNTIVGLLYNTRAKASLCCSPRDST